MPGRWEYPLRYCATFFACQQASRDHRGLEKLVDIGVAQLAIAAHVPEVVATGLVGAGNFDDQMPIATDVSILDE